MAVYGLTRVSSDGQEEGTSLETQARQIQGLCMMAGLDDAIIIKDTVSGSVPVDQRENAGPVIKGLQAGDVIIATKMDRIFRSAQDALNRAAELKTLGVDLYLIDIGSSPVTSNGTSKLFFTILAGIAEFERDRIRERTIEGRNAKVANKGFIGGKRPYGYQIVGKGKAAVLVEDDAEMAMIVRMRELAARGKSLRAIKSELGLDMSPMTIGKLIA